MNMNTKVAQTLMIGGMDSLSSVNKCFNNSHVSENRRACIQFEVIHTCVSFESENVFL